ncbi:hypothetical protein MRB53_023244 [Persea americana]|uniref:Uncharacterized protein n=1 Tax=Persea americana TaxID=3435 RepID=A0ACC2L8V6_PERAE|nr:hypothetical protein MRB53_023244 [Persea americana]
MFFLGFLKTISFLFSKTTLVSFLYTSLAERNHSKDIFITSFLSVLDGVQTLDHETDNKEDVKIKAVEKETKAEQGERKTEEHLNEPKVETRNDEAKNFGAVPMGFETARSPEKRDDGLTPPSLEKGCNYAKGRWVAESRQPLYFGFGKQWLSGPWSCRLTQRTDFSYEGWQPENCEMPNFDGSTFLKRHDFFVSFPLYVVLISHLDY